VRATITATASETRILVQDDSGDRLLARLPPLTMAAHPRALPTLLEALALWCGEVLPVALYVDETFDWQCAGLADALGLGLHGLFFRVEIIPLAHRRRRRAKRLTGLGSFAPERSADRRTG
jgi:hypothetical protein